MRLIIFSTSLLCCLFLVSCDDSADAECSGDSDCAASEKCSTESGLCVACLSSTDCEAESFCCDGICLGMEVADQHCGCAGDVGGYGGVNCEAYTLGGTQTSGPICQQSGELVTASNLREGTCGCTTSGADQCGTDNTTGLYGLCVVDEAGTGGTCAFQDTDNCGETGLICNVATGGPLCMPADETGLGGCSCDGNNNNCVEEMMDGQGNLHRIANNCSFENECVCASNTQACTLNGAAPDCCGDGCVDLRSDKDNCGLCDNSCGGNECTEGACACTENEECYAEGGSFNNPETIANECVGANATDLGACVCASYRDGEGTATACPLGSFCCFAGGDISANGCCSKPCGEATLDDCTQSIP
jgi:hypothetical protein